MKFGGITLGGKLGGWNIINQPATSLPQDLASAEPVLFGSTFKPIWLVASQIINGINYLMVAEAVRSTLKTVKRIVGIIVNIPAGSVNGEGAKVIEVIEDDELIEGTNPEDKVKEYFDSIIEPADEKLAGVGITPVLYMGSKITKGINHVVVAQRRMISSDADPEALIIEFNVFNGKATLYTMEKIAA